jgi:ribonuclease HI
VSSSPERLILNADGGARGNPGPAGCGAVLSLPDGEIVAGLQKFLGNTTNNVAEYQGLLLGLEAAKDEGASDLEVRLDSELIVRQLNGQYKVKSPHLKPLYEQAKSLLQAFDSVTIVHVRRENNREADKLANLAMDQGMCKA